MKMIFNEAKINFPGGSYRWGGILTFKGFFLMVETKGDKEHPAQKGGEEICHLLEEKLSQLKEIKLKSLEEILAPLKNRADLATLIIGALQGNILYLVSHGETEVLLKRKEKIGQILSGSDTVSGFLQSEDTFLFSSQLFARTLEKEKRKKILLSQDLKKAVELGYSFLSGQPEGLVALLLQIKTEQVSQKNPLPKISFPTKKKLVEFIAPFKNKIPQLLSQFVGQKEELSVSRNPEEKKSKKTLLTVAFALIVLLLVSIFFNFSQVKNKKKNQNLTEALELVSHQYEEAIGLIDLNPVRARTLLSDSKLTLAPLLKDFPKNSADYKKIKEWLEKVSEKEVLAYKIYKLTSVPLFFDINLVKEGSQLQQVASYRESKALLDRQNKVIYSFTTTTKKAEMVAGSEILKNAAFLTIHGKNIYFLNEEGIVRLEIQTKTAKVVIKPDEKWGEITSLAAFGGNLYLLDKRHAIWKYIATEVGFLGRSSYLNPDVRVNFTEAKQLLVDGSVWVLLGNGEILKFNRGLSEQFSFKGFSENLTNITAISTSDVDHYLYALDKESSRIVVFDKEGAYQAQYQWDELKNASDFTVSEEEKKIFVVLGSKIYAIDIQ